MIFTEFIIFLVSLRLGELAVSKRNERWLLQHGGIEFGKKHYPVIVALHTAFICSLVIEYAVQRPESYVPSLLLLYGALVISKSWVILTLGHFWTTRIYRIPRSQLVATGPYKYMKHPNYLIVVLEIAIIPLAFHLYLTALLFSVLNAFMLRVRIREENLALLS